MAQIVLHTETADSVYEMMNQGLVDIGLFLEPINTEGLDYIRIIDVYKRQLLATANGQTAMSVWNFTIYKSSRQAFFSS